MELKKLYETINLHFNQEELKLLCFSLSPQVDYESLGGDGKSGKIRELIEYCIRHGQLDELINYCQDSRPKVDWFKSITTSQNVSGKEIAPIFNISEINSLIGFIKWRQSREGYSSTSAISKLKEKLLRQRDSLEKTGQQDDNFGSIEFSLLLETVEENIRYIQTIPSPKNSIN